VKLSVQKVAALVVIVLTAATFALLLSRRKPAVRDLAPGFAVLDTGFTSGKENEFRYRDPINNAPAAEQFRTPRDTNVLWIVLEAPSGAWFNLQCSFTNTSGRRVAFYCDATHQGYGARRAIRKIDVLPFAIPDPETIQKRTISFSFVRRPDATYSAESLPNEGRSAFRIKIR
jgi:hypothetical protein